MRRYIIEKHAPITGHKRTAKEVHHVLKMKGKLDEFPLFVTIYEISFEGKPVDQLAAFAE